MKLRVLLVPADFHHAEGAIAKFIAAQCPGLEAYFFSAHEIRKRPQEFIRLAKSVDVIHWLMNFCNVSLPDGWTHEHLPCPSVATVHHVDTGEEKKILYAQKADVVHVVSREWYEKLTPVFGSQLVFARMGIEIGAFSRNRAVKKPRKVFRLGTFGFPRSLNDRKRLDVLLDCLKNLQSSGYKFEFIVQGYNWNFFAQKLAELGIPCIHKGLAFSDDVWKSYHEIDCYLCSSDCEGGPIGVLEALASGVPVVSTSVGIAREVLNLGGGLICPVNNPSFFTASVKKIMDDPALYHRCCAEGPSIVEVVLKESADGYEKMYQCAVSRWEEKVGRKWTPPDRSALPVAEQRRREILVDRYREAMALISMGEPLRGMMLALNSSGREGLSTAEKAGRTLSCFGALSNSFFKPREHHE